MHEEDVHTIQGVWCMPRDRMGGAANRRRDTEDDRAYLMGDAPRWKRRPNEADDGTIANAYDIHVIYYRCSHDSEVEYHDPYRSM